MAGRHKKTGSESTHQVRKISKLLPYPNPLDDNYNPLDKDLTLIKFDQPVTYNDYVSPVCLPERAPVTQDLCIVAGWGEVDGKYAFLMIMYSLHFQYASNINRLVIGVIHIDPFIIQGPPYQPET